VFLGKELTKRYLGFIELLDNERMRLEAERILLEQLGMDFKGRWEPIFQMSGGQRQAVALARAIYAKASLVILDEPMASLGVEEVERTIAIIQRLRESSVAVIVISHNLEHVFAVADRWSSCAAGARSATPQGPDHARGGDRADGRAPRGEDRDPRSTACRERRERRPRGDARSRAR
jgi:ABC-type sugar transport system ATPase subunit